MNWRFIIAICVAFFVNENVSFEGRSLPEAGYAWEYNSTMDLILADVKSSEICGDLCLKNETCQGYSWEKGGTVILVKKPFTSKTCFKCFKCYHTKRVCTVYILKDHVNGFNNLYTHLE